MLKSKKGITLIALAITIIVFAILAAIAINLTVNKNGLLDKAKEAKLKTEIQENKTELENFLLNKKIEKRKKTTEAYTKAEFLEDVSNELSSSYEIRGEEIVNKKNNNKINVSELFSDKHVNIDNEIKKEIENLNGNEFVFTTPVELNHNWVRGANVNITVNEGDGLVIDWGDGLSPEVLKKGNGTYYHPYNRNEQTEIKIKEYKKKERSINISYNLDFSTYHEDTTGITIKKWGSLNEYNDIYISAVFDIEDSLKTYRTIPYDKIERYLNRLNIRNNEIIEKVKKDGSIKTVGVSFGQASWLNLEVLLRDLKDINVIAGPPLVEFIRHQGDGNVFKNNRKIKVLNGVFFDAHIPGINENMLYSMPELMDIQYMFGKARGIESVPENFIDFRKNPNLIELQGAFYTGGIINGPNIWEKPGFGDKVRNIHGIYYDGVNDGWRRYEIQQ